MAEQGIIKPVGNFSDTLKWAAVAILVISGFGGSYYIANFLMTESSHYYQIGIWVLIVAASIGLAVTTQPGQQFIQFAKDARMEIRKVVWPNRQETMQATLMVLAAVVIMSLLLWFIDMVLFYIINFITT
jgi:preprotein translocase subunit SecE